MSDVRIKIGGPIFRKIRENSNYYVDKTAFIEEFLNTDPPEASLITRPRRFGKTLTMNMLNDFFDITQDSKAIFEGLAISKNKALCDKWMNQYPTVQISLKEMEGDNFYEAMVEYSHIIERLCGDLSYLQESPLVRQQEKDTLACLGKVSKEKDVLNNSLVTLCRALYAHWDRPVVLLIDEYDVPLARAQENGYYPDMVKFVRKLLGSVLKDSKIIQFAILTGCLRISKESTFTGLNNLKCYGISDVRFADKFGFTSNEVDDLLSAAGFPEKKDIIKEWYDGYRFGDDTEIYCPWDILQYIEDLQAKATAKPKAYWKNTSGNNTVRDFIGNTTFKVSSKIEKLLADGYVTSSINEGLTYDSLYESEENLWTLLYLTGYLTTASPDLVKDSDLSSDSEALPLVIPNKEVKAIFIKTIKSWFDDTMKAMDRKPLFDAFWNGDSEGFQEKFSGILLKSISFHDYHENFYHAVLTGTFIGAGWEVTSNPESGLGRLDILVKDEDNARAAIIEVKRSKTAGEMAKDAEATICQLNKKRYVSSLEGHYKKIMFWGISFWKKSCAAKAEEYVQPQPQKG
ncbi:MAG: AAA family ATPase [Desulfovibrionaceae bacterium]|nr:AAA family ATPase [Desulfovibrionaceae bacterium]